MKISSRFTIAVHMLTLIALNQDKPDIKLTSDFIAGSVGVNPVIIRKTLSQLKKADLISVARGTGGAALAKPAEAINLFEVYQAVESVGENLFSFHDNPNPACPVGRNIHGVLDGTLEAAQEAMEQELADKTLAQVLEDAQDLIQNENL